MVFPDSDALLSELSKSTGPCFRQLNKAVAKLVDGFGMVGFSPLDISDEDRCGNRPRHCFCKCTALGCLVRNSAMHAHAGRTARTCVCSRLLSRQRWAGTQVVCTCSIAAVLLQIDMAIQYGEDLDVDTRDHDVGGGD
jgi:hypothetical protein